MNKLINSGRSAWRLALALAPLSWCWTAPAQAQWSQSPVRWQVLTGYSATLGRTADYLQGGYLLAGGFSVTPSAASPLDFRFDLSYSRHQASQQLLAQGQTTTTFQVDNGSGQIWSATGNVAYHVPIAYGVRGYGIAGVGAYHARIELTQLYYAGLYYNCDPYIDYCYGSGLGEQVVAAHDTTKVGWNAGVGIEFALPGGQSWFVESRYHRMETSQPIQYVPIAIGYRF